MIVLDIKKCIIMSYLDWILSFSVISSHLSPLSPLEPPRAILWWGLIVGVPLRTIKYPLPGGREEVTTEHTTDHKETQ